MVAFFTDGCFSGVIVRALQAAGFEAVRVIDVCPGGDDRQVLAMAYDQGRILPTEDYDFGELCVRFWLPTHGVVIVALKGISGAKQAERVVNCLSVLGDRIIGSFVTIEAGRVRQRRLPAWPPNS